MKRFDKGASTFCLPYPGESPTPSSRRVSPLLLQDKADAAAADRDRTPEQRQRQEASTPRTDTERNYVLSDCCQFHPATTLCYMSTTATVELHS